MGFSLKKTQWDGEGEGRGEGEMNVTDTHCTKFPKNGPKIGKKNHC